MTTPWDPLPGESSKAYAAFGIYRDLGRRRSVDEASRLYHPKTPPPREEPPPRKREASGQIRTWAQRWNWGPRALAWDQELEHAKQNKQIEAIEEMAERHAREALMLQNKAVERLRQLGPEELTPREILAFLIEAAKLERLARGEPTERLAQEHRFPDVKELTDEELARIVASRSIPSGGGRGTARTPYGPEKPS
jgi:hypothetical protein